MKNKNIISSFVGAGFFAIGYLGLSLALPPALALGAVSFVASELIVTGADKKIGDADTVFDILYGRTQDDLLSAAKDSPHFNIFGVTCRIKGDL